MQDFLSKLSPKEKKIFYITAIVVSLALSDRLFLGPAMNRIDAIDQEIVNLKVNMAQDQQFLSYQDRILKESQAYAKYIPKTLKDDDEINTEFFRIIEKLAKSSEVNLIKSNPAKTKSEKGYVEYYANLDIAGTLENVIGFMHTLNSSTELFKIVRFDMAPRRGADGEVQTTMTVVKLIIKPNQL